MRKAKYGPEFMAKVALAALQKDKTMPEVFHSKHVFLLLELVELSQNERYEL